MGFLDTIIPWVIAVVGVFILFRPLKKPLSELWGGIKGLFERFRSSKDEVVKEKTLQFE